MSSIKKTNVPKAQKVSKVPYVDVKRTKFYVKATEDLFTFTKEILNK